MAYQKQIWENLPSTNTPINADRLNHMEDGIADAWEHGGGGGGDTLPIGIILPLSSDTIPEGYLLCDGSEISRTTYSTLFSVIGTTYGAGDGSTTFNIPDLQGKVPVGQDSEDTDFDTLGETGGEKTHTLTIQEMPSHDHEARYGGTAGGDGTGYRYSNTDGKNRFIIENEGGGQAHNNLQPYLTVKYIIKALNAQTGDVRSESLPVGSEIDFDGESTDIPTGWEQIIDPKAYSETEAVIGTWINGKPLYRKSVFVNSLPNNATVNYPHNISDVDLIWFDKTACFAIWNYGQNNQFTNSLTFFNPTGAGHIALSNAGKTGFDIITSNDRSNLKGYVTLLYTKTTD